MNYLRLAFTLAVPIFAGCSDSAPPQPAAGVTPAPRRNLSESMGFMSDADGGLSPEPTAAAPAVPAAAVASPIRRTLRGSDGRTLDAVLLSRTATTVRIRRQADAAEFTIPLEKLSQADCDFILKSALPVKP